LCVCRAAGGRARHERLSRRSGRVPRRCWRCRWQRQRLAPAR
jgi:hypothetical protein